MSEEPAKQRPDAPLPRGEPSVAAGTQPLPVARRGLSDRPLIGIACALAGISGFAVMDALAKYLGGDYPLGQVVFLRNLFALLPLSLLLWHGGGLAALKTQHPVLQILRGCGTFGAIMCFFGGLQYLGLAEATALAFAAPLFITALSVPLLGEQVGRHRWSAVLVGFLGVLIMVRPGSESLRAAALLPLAAAFFYGLAMNFTRKLSRTDTTPGIAVWGNLTSLTLSSLLLPFAWISPQGHDIWLFVAMGLTGGCSAYVLTLAYRYAAAAVIAPFDYVALLWAVGLGWLVWRELPDAWTWAGVAVLIASGLYILHRETRRG